MQGWIKIHRSILDWEWYGDINMTRLFTHLILKANHKDKRREGIIIKRGQIKTGRIQLSLETGLSQQSIRTCLSKLKSTNEITIKVTSKFSIITIVKFDTYQENQPSINHQSNQQTNQPPTSDQPAANQQSTTNKNVKKLKNGKNDGEILGETLLPINFNRWPQQPTSEFIELIYGYRKDKDKPKFTQNTINRIGLHLSSAIAKGFTYQQCVEKWEDKGWVTFEPEYMEIKQYGAKPKAGPIDYDNIDYSVPEGCVNDEIPE